MGNISSLIPIIKGIACAVGLAIVIFSLPAYTEAKSKHNDEDAYKVQYRIITGIIIFAIGVSPVVGTIVNLLSLGSLNDLNSIRDAIKGVICAVGLAIVVFTIPAYTEAKSKHNDEDAYRMQYRIITGVIIYAIGVSPVLNTIIGYLDFSGLGADAGGFIGTIF